MCLQCVYVHCWWWSLMGWSRWSRAPGTCQGHCVLKLGIDEDALDQATVAATLKHFALRKPPRKRCRKDHLPRISAGFHVSFQVELWTPMWPRFSHAILGYCHFMAMLMLPKMSSTMRQNGVPIFRFRSYGFCRHAPKSPWRMFVIQKPKHGPIGGSRLKWLLEATDEAVDLKRAGKLQTSRDPAVQQHADKRTKKWYTATQRS